MIRLVLALFMAVLVSGCGRDADRPQTLPVPSTNARASAAERVTLREARKNFKTTLVRKIGATKPIPVPPPDLFQLVSFESPVGQLPAYLTPEPKDGKKHPAIIWITGGDYSTVDESLWEKAPASNDQTARQFREAGIVLMFPTLRGGSPNIGLHEGFFGEVDDVLSAADFLSKQPFVDPQRIYLGGHSSGATLALLVAECSSRFRAAFSVGPTHDIRDYPVQYDGIFKPFDTSNEREFDLRAPGLWLHSIQVPAFVFTGTVRDGALPSVEMMSRNSSNSKVHFFLVEGANHFDILAPTNRLIAAKILRDDGPECNIAFTAGELSAPFTK
jgi:dipeptidyl aminopeptidase/acylaminoacyl peptidase